MKNESERLIELESQLAHLQHQYDALNEVITEQASRLQSMHKRVEKWEQQVDRLKNASDSASDPLEERPPHY